MLIIRAKSACIIIKEYNINCPTIFPGDLDLHNVERFLNRLLGLQPEIQNSYVLCYLQTKTLHFLYKQRNISIWIQAFWVFCEHLWSSSWECAPRRSFWLRNSWYESQYNRIKWTATGYDSALTVIWLHIKNLNYKMFSILIAEGLRWPSVWSIHFSI